MVCGDERCESYEFWAGNPARHFRKRFDDETIRRLEEVKWWDFNDDMLREIGRLVPYPELFLEEVEPEKGKTINECRHYGNYFDKE